MPRFPRPTGGPAAVAILVILMAGCAGSSRTGSPGAAAAVDSSPAAGRPMAFGDEPFLSPPAGFAPDDLAGHTELEAALAGAIDARAGALGLEAARGRGGSDADLPPVAASLLATFEAAGLDAGAWPFTQGEQDGVNVMARIEGSDRPAEIILLAATYPAQGGRQARRPAAVLAAAAHGLGAVAAEGWQPRRTIMLAAWDGTVPSGGARAWLEHGPLDVPAITLAALAVVPRRGDAPVAAAGPALRPLVAGLLAGDDAPGDPEARGEAGLLLARGVPLIEVGAAPDADPHRVATAAWRLARLALRLADAGLPDLSPAAAAQRALTASRELEQAAQAASTDNPPPLRELRLALLEMRDAGEAWSRAGETALARMERVPRGPEGMAARSRLAAATDAVRAAIRLEDPTPRAPGACASLLLCPGDDGPPARLLPGLRRAITAGDREAVVARALLLAAAARESALRLQQAADMLQSTPEESP